MGRKTRNERQQSQERFLERNVVELAENHCEWKEP